MLSSNAKIRRATRPVMESIEQRIQMSATSLGVTPLDWGAPQKLVGERYASRYAFVASDPQHGGELWTTDGTSAGTKMLADLNVGKAGSDPHFIGQEDSYIYFTANDGTARQLYVLRGSEPERVMPGSPADTFANVESITTFRDSSFIATSTVTGKRSLFDIVNNRADLLLPLDADQTQIVHGNTVLYTSGGRLFTRAIPYNPDSSLAAPTDLGFSDVTIVGSSWDTFAFTARNANGRLDLWQTTALAPAKLVVADIGSQASDLRGTSGGNNFYFTTDHGGVYEWTESNLSKLSSETPDVFQFAGSFIYTTKSSDGGTDVHGFTSFHLPNNGIDPTNVSSFLTESLFIAADPTHGQELWRIDGPTHFRVTELGAGALGAELSEAAAITIASKSTIGIRNGVLWNLGETPNSKPANPTFFAGADADHGLELWVTDEFGTRMLKDVVAGAGGSNPADFRKVATGAYFTADDGTGGRDTWFTDGTNVGTTRVLTAAQLSLANSMPDSPDSTIWGIHSGGMKIPSVTFVHTINGRKVFWADSRMLFSTDGTAAGTIALGTANDFAFANGKVWGISNTRVWRTDGTLEGTADWKTFTLPPHRTNGIGYLYKYAIRDAKTGYITVYFDERVLNMSSGLFVIVAGFGFDPNASDPVQPPSQQPPVSQPPVSQPPVSQPPVSQPQPPLAPPPQASHSTLSNGVLRINGTKSRDTIEIFRAPSNPHRLIVNFHGRGGAVFDVSAVTTIILNAGKGDDVINVKENYGAIFANVRIDGGPGADQIYGGSGNDSLYGGDGNDVIYGRGGRDRIDGGLGTDKLYGGAGKDWYVHAKTGELKDKEKGDLLVI